MIDSKNLLVIGNAIVQTVRYYIKYSVNMRGEDQLFESLENKRYQIFPGRKSYYRPFNSFTKSEFYKELEYKTMSLNNDCKKTGYNFNYGKKALEIGTGVCDHLSLACLYIAQGQKSIILNQKYYISLMSCYGHVFLLIHQNDTLLKSKRNQHQADSWNDLSKIKELENAIIVDPWIYKATELKHFNTHIKHAALYNVENYYNTRGIKIKENEHIAISQSQQVNHINPEYVTTFNKFYEDEKQKLDNCNKYLAIGVDFNDIRNSLIIDANKKYTNKIITIQSYYRKYRLKLQQNLEVATIKIQTNYRGYKIRDKIEKQKQVISFKNFLKNLNSQPSGWFSKGFTQRNTKKDIINSVIKYLELCIIYDNYPSDIKLVNLFKKIITILPIVRSSNKIPYNLNSDNIEMTSTAINFLKLNVVPANKLEFEKINGLSLQWIRNTRNSSNTDREKYKILLKKINSWNPPYNIGNLLQNLYINKDGYYSLVLSEIYIEI